MDVSKACGPCLVKVLALKNPKKLKFFDFIVRKSQNSTPFCRFFNFADYWQICRFFLAFAGKSAAKFKISIDQSEREIVAF